MPKDVTQRNESAGVATSERSAVYAQWVNAMQIEAGMNEGAAFDPSELLGSILGADNFDDAVALQDSSLQSGKDLVGWEHRITGFDLITSDNKYADNERSLGVYARVTGIDLETGEERTYGCGASNVLAILWQARNHGRIPGDFVIKSRPVQSGGDLLSLRPIGRRTVAVKAE